MEAKIIVVHLHYGDVVISHKHYVPERPIAGDILDLNDTTVLTAFTRKYVETHKVHPNDREGKGAFNLWKVKKVVISGFLHAHCVKED